MQSFPLSVAYDFIFKTVTYWRAKGITLIKSNLLTFFLYVSNSLVILQIWCLKSENLTLLTQFSNRKLVFLHKHWDLIHFKLLFPSICWPLFWSWFRMNLEPTTIHSLKLSSFLSPWCFHSRPVTGLALNSLCSLVNPPTWNTPVSASQGISVPVPIPAYIKG